MGGGKKRKQGCEEEGVIIPGHESNTNLSAARRLFTEIATKYSEVGLIMPFVPPASGSVDSEVDTFLHGSEDECDAQRRPEKVTLTGTHLQGLVEELLRTGQFGAEQKNQLDPYSSPSPSPQQGFVEVDSNVLPSSSTQPPPLPCYPRRPNPYDCTPEEFLNWRVECTKIRRARKKVPLSSDFDNNLPTLRSPKDDRTANAVQDWKFKKAVLAAARSVVSVTSTSDDGPQCTGFILHRYEHSGVVFSVIVTCSAVVCERGKKLDPLPKLSVGLPDRKTVIEAHLLYFSDHFDIALLLVPFELSLDIPRLGCCPDYDQEIFVLGRDKEASLKVRHGVISWTEESDFIGRDYYMFLDGQVPAGGTGGPVIDHDGVFRGMAFKLSPMPAVLSISTIMICLTMFMHFGRIARPMLGLSLRTVASVDVDILECLSEEHNIKSGYIVEGVRSNSPAEGCGICKGNVIVSLNGHNTLTLHKLEDYLLSLGWKNLINSVSTTDLKLVICDLKGQTRSITMPVGFCSNPEHEG